MTPIARIVNWFLWLRAKPRQCWECGDMLTGEQTEFCTDQHAIAWQESHAV